MSTLIHDPRILMLHCGRCGSTVLGSLINAQPYSRWLGELLYRFPDVDPITKANEMLDGALLGGWEFKAGQSLDYTETALRLKGEGYVIVHLYRRNYLRCIISYLIASNNKRWWAKTQNPKESVHIEWESISIHNRENIGLISTIQQFEQFNLNFSELSDISICYEDEIKDNPNFAARRIFSQFKLPYIDFQPNLKRLNPYPIKEIVGNYSKLTEILSGTPYEWMCNE